MRRHLLTLSTCALMAAGLATPCSGAEKAAMKSTTKVQTKMLPLIQNGRSDYVIALADDAIPAEKTAANELQSYLKEATGAELPIREEKDVAADARQIVVGSGARAKSLVPQKSWDALGNDGIILQNDGSRLVLAGTRPRGTIYAVYEFLEKYAGVRWWTPTEQTVPHQPSLSIPAVNMVYTPPFGYREHYSYDVQIDPLFATRMRENGDHQTQDEKLGGHYVLLYFVHTFSKLMPIETYFKEHPEWYSDPANGNKPCTKDSKMPEGGNWQLNLTDPAMRAEFKKNVLAAVKEHRITGMISVSQNDNNNYCRSEGDLKMMEEEGSPSGPLIDLINDIADEVHKVAPEFLVETLAYEYTTKAPAHIKPRDNVVIRICPIGDIGRPIDSDANAKMRDVIKDWRKIAKHLYIWDYVTNFSQGMMPHPNIRTIAPNMRFFAQSNVFGMFEQGDAYTNSTGDFVPLRTWLTSRLMWNPELDDSKLMDEFLNGYYGAAGPHLRKYIDLIQSSFLKQGTPLGMYEGNFAYFTLDVANKGWAHFEAAANAVAGDPVLTRRVRQARISFNTAIINRASYLRREAAGGKPAPSIPQDMKTFVEDYIATNKEFKTISYSERQTFDAFAEQARRKVTPAPMPAEMAVLLSPKQNPNEIVQIKDYDFFYTAWTHQEVDDPQASDGRTSRITGQSEAEQLLFYYLQEPNKPGYHKWDIYVRARLETKEGADFTKPVFAAGTYNRETKEYPINQKITDPAFADGKYHLVKVGTWSLRNGDVVWVTPVGRQDIPFIYVDQMILVPAK